MQRFRTAAGPLVLLLIVTGFFWKLLTTQYTWLDHPDMAYQVLPWYQFQAVSWHHGHFPLWDPHVWAGQPLVGQLQPGAAYPPNWLLFLAPLKDGHIQKIWMHFYFIITHFLAALFCYWLCRDLRRTVAASVLAGAAFALSGVVASVGWPQMLNGAIWIPLVVLFFLRSVRGDRPLANAAFSGAFLGVSFLSGHHQIPAFVTLMMACLWVFEIKVRRLVALKSAGEFVLFAGLISAFQVWPAFEYGVRSIRWVGAVNPVFWGQYVPYSVHQQYSLLPSGILNLILPGTSQHTFVGLVVLTLALIGFIHGFGTRDARIFGAICAGGLLLALGGFSIFHGIAYLVFPLIEKARTPAMAVVLVQFAFAVLAAYGLDALRVRVLGRWWVPVLTGIGILPWPVLAVLPMVRAETSLEYQRLAMLGVVALALAALLYAWTSKRISESVGVGLCFVLMLLELGTATGSNFRDRDHPGGFLAELQRNRDVVEFLRKQPDFIRLEVGTEGLPFNIGDWDGIDQFRAYLGGMTNNVARFEDDRLKGGRLATMLFALNYFAGPASIRPEQELVFQGASGLNVYRNPNAFPRTWTVHTGSRVDVRKLIPALRNTDLRNRVFLTEPVPRFEECAGSDEVRSLERSDDRVRLEARMACSGMVVVSQTYFPGWDARVDGRATHLYEAYGALQGFVVPPGTHEVELLYRPRSVYGGAALSIAGMVASLLLAFGRRRRGRWQEWFRYGMLSSQANTERQKTA
jgi:Bacterial membrane protein YfhO